MFLLRGKNNIGEASRASRCDPSVPKFDENRPQNFLFCATKFFRWKSESRDTWEPFTTPAAPPGWATTPYTLRHVATVARQRAIDGKSALLVVVAGDASNGVLFSPSPPLKF